LREGRMWLGLREKLGVGLAALVQRFLGDVDR
jgi:hypothetical protein